MLFVDGAPEAIVPDLIMNLHLETGEPITTEILRYGQQLAVIGMPAHELMKTPEALKVVGPKAFGYPDIDIRSAAIFEFCRTGEAPPCLTYSSFA